MKCVSSHSTHKSYHFIYYAQKEQIIPTTRAPQKGSEKPADSQNAHCRPEPIQSVDGENAQTTTYGDCSVSKLIGRTYGHTQSGHILTQFSVLRVN